MISVVIPTYRNTRQLVSNLQHNLPFLRGNEVIVVNDYPSQSIKNDLAALPDVVLIENSRNLGFAGAVHEGILKAKNRFVMLLNDDVLLNDTSFVKTVKTLEQDKTVFAVSFCQEEKGGSRVGKNTVYWNDGLFQHKKAADLEAGINGWAEGGSCMIDREKYVKLGGFDTLYSPFYWEDVDLSYRAWKAGYQILFDPGITVVHHHESTIGKQFDRTKVKSVAYRNQFIFIWKNIGDGKMLFRSALKTVFLLPVMIFRDRPFVTGMIQALWRLPGVLQKRYKGVLSDAQVLNKFR